VLHLATQLLLSPILIPQAIGVVRRALHLPEATGPRSGTLGGGPPLHLLIIGDSSAAGVGVETQDQALAGQLTRNLAEHFKVSWHLHARSGATTQTTWHSLQTPPAVRADIIVIALGVNDVTHAVPFLFWRLAQKRLLAHLIQTYSPQQIYLSGMPPLGDFPLLPNPLRWSLGRQAKRFDKAQRQRFAARPRVPYAAIDLPLDPTQMAKDGFHPGAEVYALWGKEMASRIISDWPSFQR
jgi:lysophospholipase L1-like esterase